MSRSQEDRERISRERFEAARVLKVDKSDQLDLALSLLDDSLQHNPINTNALPLFSQLLCKQHNTSSSLCALSVAIKLEERSPTPDLRHLASLYGSRALLHVKQRRVQAAIMDLKAAIQLEADNGVWYFELGQAYYREDNYFFALNCYQAALQQEKLDRHKIKCLIGLGSCKLKIGDYPAAITAFTKALEGSETPALRNWIGLAYYLSGSFQKALEEFQKAADLSPQKYEYHLNRGVCSFKLGMDSEAQHYFTNAISQCKSKSPKLLFFRGGAQLLLNFLPQAHEDLEDAIKLKPNSEYLYTRGLIFFAQGNLDEAKRCFSRALRAEPNAWRYLLHTGIVHHLLGEQFAAVSYYHRALRLVPTQKDLLELTGLAYVQLGFYPTAVHVFSSCVCLQPSEGLYHFHKAVAQVLSKNPYGALESLKVLKQLNFSREGLRHVYSVTLRLLQDYKGSLDYADKATEEDNKQYIYFFNRAEVHFAMGAYQKCIDDCQRVVDLFEFGEAYFLKGRAYHALGACKESLDSFANAKRLNAHLANTHVYYYNVAVVLSTQTRWKEALEAIESALRVSPVAPLMYVHERAKLKQFTQNVKGAVEDFNYVLERQPANFNALLRRAFALRDLRRYDEAALDLAKAGSIDTSGVLAEFSKDFFFETECFELCPPGNEDNEEPRASSTF